MKTSFFSRDSTTLHDKRARVAEVIGGCSDIDDFDRVLGALHRNDLHIVEVGMDVVDAAVEEERLKRIVASLNVTVKR